MIDEQQQRPWWVELLQRQGLPTVLVMGMCYAGWCSVAWFAPKVDTVITGHLEYLRTSEANQKAMIENQGRIVIVGETQAKVLQDMQDKTGTLANQKIMADNQARLISVSESQSEILKSMAARASVVDSKIDDIHRVIIRNDKPVTIKTGDPGSN